MDIGLFIGSIGSAGTLQGQIDQIIEAENDGFDSFWAAHIMDLDIMTMMSMAAQQTKKIKMGTAVTPTFLRHPIAMAQQAITVQASAQGRFTLGMGVSHKPVVENRFGLEFKQPAKHMKEYLSIVNSLSMYGKVNHRGEIHTAVSEFTSKERPALSVVIAALGNLMLKNAGELADGTVTWMTGPETVKNHITPKITQSAHKAGKKSPRIVVGLPLCVTDKKETGFREASKHFGRYGDLPSYRAMINRENAESPAELAAIGNEQEIEEKLREYASAGATEIAAQIFPETPGDKDSILRSRETLLGLIGRIG